MQIRIVVLLGSKGNRSANIETAVVGGSRGSEDVRCIQEEEMVLQCDKSPLEPHRFRLCLLRLAFSVSFASLSLLRLQHFLAKQLQAARPKEDHETDGCGKVEVAYVGEV